MLNKLLRTIIGLPFVLVAWLPLFTLLFLIILPVVITAWCRVGVYDGDTYERNILKDTQYCLTLPYQFLKKVWKDEN